MSARTPGGDSGAIIGGKYELHDAIGEGGMATVWRATMRGAAGFSRKVAVKQIKQQFDASDHYIRMFVEEARVGSELAHPNIVQVVDFCMDEAGAYYLVMEWVDGLDLSAFVRSHRKEGSTPWALVAGIGIGTLRGLSAAHERRREDGTPAPVIHRDVSPHNILLARNGVAKLSDFGLARARDRMDSLTGPGMVKGKLSYWAPEIAGGGEASPSSDIFAMGVVLWESLAARRLFTGDTDVQVYQKVLACEVPLLSEIRSDLPDSLVQVVARAVAAAPDARFPTARSMAQALATVLAESGSGDAHGALARAILEARHRLGGKHLPRNTPVLGVPTGLSREITFSDSVDTVSMRAIADDDDRNNPNDRNNVADSIDIQFSEAGLPPGSREPPEE